MPLIIDVREWSNCRDIMACRVYVDGREIAGVWYVDRDAGVVKSYETLPDGSVMSRIFRGQVELLPFD